MPTRRLVIPALAAAAFLACEAAAQEPARFHAEACPVPAGVEGYPVTVRAADGGALDSAYARRLAAAVAYRWQPPSARRTAFAGMRRIRDRIVAPSPRWPDDWRPTAEHAARVSVTLTPRGAGEPELLAPVGDRAFERSLHPLFREDPTGQHPFPELPAGADSLRVIVGFGVAPSAEDAGVVRFAAHQQPVRVAPGSLRVASPPPGPTSRPPRATVKYDVDATGRVVPASIQVLESSTSSFARAVESGLRQAGFTPAQHDCRAIPLSVIQQFGGG
jgi:hypothetical protein